MNWTVEVLNEAVETELSALPTDLQAKFKRIVGLIGEIGLDKMREPHVKHLEGKLWEIRMQGQDGIARALYVTATGYRVVVVRAFTKKSQKTPRHEIELALERAKEVE